MFLYIPCLPLCITQGETPTGQTTRLRGVIQPFSPYPHSPKNAQAVLERRFEICSTSNHPKKSRTLHVGTSSFSPPPGSNFRYEGLPRLWVLYLGDPPWLDNCLQLVHKPCLHFMFHVIVHLILRSWGIIPIYNHMSYSLNS